MEKYKLYVHAYLGAYDSMNDILAANLLDTLTKCAVHYFIWWQFLYKTMPGNLISQNDKCKDLKREEKIQFGATKP